MNSFYSLNRFLRVIIPTVIVLSVIISSCEVSSFTEEVNGEGGNTPPTINNVSISIMGDDDQLIQVSDTVPVFQSFNVSVSAADESPGLSFAFLEIINDDGDLVFSSETRLQGITDVATFEILGDTIPRDDDYIARLTIEDTEGSAVISEASFFGRAPFSVNDQMFLLGTFNGFNGTDRQMTLVDEYTWQFIGSIAGDDAFKFANTPDFSGNDWGDAECDNQAEPGTLDNNIACGINLDTAVFTFNDLTLEYSILPGDGSFISNFEEVFIIGNFTGWGGNESGLSISMELTDNNTWEAIVVAMETVVDTDNQNSRDGDFNVEEGDEIQFKFVLGPDFGPQDFGDDEQDGIAEDTGSESNIIPGLGAGTYIVVFNDFTLEYTIESTIASNFDELFIIGNITGWGGDNSDLSVPMQLVGDNSWEVEIDATMPVDGVYTPGENNIEFKVVTAPVFPNQGIDGVEDFGVTPGEDNTSLMGILFDGDGEQNIIQPPLATYRATFTFNDETLEYVLTPQ